MASLATIAQGSERPILTVTWCHADNTTGEDLTGATITGYIKDLATGNVAEIQGTFAITDAANGVFTWTPDPLDVAVDGAYPVQFSAVFAGEPTPARTAVFEWEIVESIIPTDAPTELPDYQGVVKLLARTTDPDNPATGYWGMYVKDGGLYLIDSAGTLVGPFGDPAAAAAAAVATHVALADPHAQYLTEAAAASTYSASGHTHDYAASGHNHDAAYISVIATPTAGNLPTMTAGGELATSAYAPASFATAGHDHDADYAAGDHNHTGTYAAASHTHPASEVTDFAEAVDDRVNALLVQGSNVTLTYDDTANTLTVAATGASYTDEQAQDAAASLFTTATHTGVSVSYNDGAATLAITNTDGGAAAVSTHEGAGDPHPQYLTSTEGNAAYATAGHNHDSAYISVIGTPTEGNIPTITAGGELANSAYAPSSFATSGHTHAYIAESLIDAKGDIIVGSADNTPAKLTVGVTNGHVLTINSGATNGVEWAAVSASGSVATDAIWDTKGDLAVGTGANTAAKLAAGTNGYHLVAASGEATGLQWAAPVRYLTLGSSGTLTATAKTARLYVPFACTVTNVAASVGTAPTGASVVADVLLNGTTLWGTNPGSRPTITATNYADLTNTPDTTAIAAGDYLTLTIATVGSTIAGADLNVIVTVTVP
jgi:hypothetical protein